MLFFAHLSLFDHVNAAHLVNRASFRYKDAALTFFKPYLGIIEKMSQKNYEAVAEDFAGILKKNSTAELSDILTFVLNLIVYVHIP